MKRIRLLFSLLIITFIASSCSSSSTDSVAINTDQSPIISGVLNVGVENLGGKSYRFIPQMININDGNYSYAWDFGDGAGKSTEKEPVYTYRSAGIYEIKLSLKSGSTVVKTAGYTLMVTESGSIIYDRISAKPDSINDRLYIFEALATSADGSKLTYEWNFGDGENVLSESSIVEHEFDQYGKSYNVTVTVKNSQTQDSQEDSIVIETPKPVLAFDVTNIPGNSRQKTFKAYLNGVSNTSDITYNWDFGDGSTKTVYDNAPLLHEFPAKNGQNVYTVTLNVTSSTLTEKLTYSMNIDVTLDFALTMQTYKEVTDDKLTYEYSVIGTSDNESNITDVTYKWIFPDGTTTSVAGAATGVASQTKGVTTKRYERYLNNYDVVVEAYSNNNLLAKTTIRHSFVSPVYDLQYSADDVEPLSVTFQVTESYHIDNATYEWDFGSQQEPQTTNTPTVTYKYTTSGSFIATVTIKSINAPDMTPVVLTKNLLVKQNIKNPTFSCNNNESEDGLTYTCVSNAAIENGTLGYKWTVDGSDVGNSNSRTFTTKLGKYNQSYNIGLVVTIENINLSEKINNVINTPKPVVIIDGKSSVIAKEDTAYSARYEITKDNGEKREVSISNKVHKWLINNSVSYATETITHQFGVNDDEGLSVVRNVDLTVSSNEGNLSGEITGRLPVTVTRQPAGMEDVQSINLTCSPVNDFNLVKQNCNVAITFKNDRPTDTDNFTARIEGGTNGAQTVKIGSNAQLIFDWPEQNVTGKSSSRTFEVTATVYKNDNVNNNMTTKTNVTVRNYVSYVLFPMPYKNSYGGTGSRLSTYSCGYNSFYSEGQYKGGDCEESQSASGATLSLGNLVDGSGKAKADFTAKWGYNINFKSGVNKSGVIKTVSVKKGQSIPADLKKFDFEEAFKRDSTYFVGEVYGESDANNVFYLEISDALDKPLRITYNGNNFQSRGNRLKILAPTMFTENYDNYYRQCHIRNISSGNMVKMQAISVKYYFEPSSLTVTPADQMAFYYAVDFMLTNGNTKSGGMYTNGTPVKFQDGSGNGINDNNNVGTYVLESGVSVKQFTNGNVTLKIKNMLRGHSTQNTYLSPYRSGSCYSD